MEAAQLPDLPHLVGAIDFREVPATQEQKIWMVNLIINHTESAASLAKKYHYSRDHLNKMVQRRLKGKAIQSKRGRPQLLDQNSQGSINTKIHNAACTSLSHLKQSIDEEFKATFARRYPSIVTESENDELEPKMSRRSLKRYVFMLHPGVFPSPIPEAPNLA